MKMWCDAIEILLLDTQERNEVRADIVEKGL